MGRAEGFFQGLDSIGLRVTFLNRYDDEAKIEILSAHYTFGEAPIRSAAFCALRTQSGIPMP
jgi:hypothetical protein